MVSYEGVRGFVGWVIALVFLWVLFLVLMPVWLRVRRYI